MNYGKYTLDQIEAIINKLGGEEGADALLRDELIIQPKPLPFPRNENGHYVLKIVGRALTGREEIVLLREGASMSVNTRCRCSAAPESTMKTIVSRRVWSITSF
jgi:hypothetical protein